jgi:hypothetical protein
MLCGISRFYIELDTPLPPRHLPKKRRATMLKRTLISGLFAVAVSVPLSSIAAEPVALNKLVFKSGAATKMTKPELEEIFELTKGTLVGKPLLPAKPLFMEGLNVAVAESRFLQIDGQGKVSGLFGKVEASTKKVQIYVDYGRYKTFKDASGADQKIGYLLRLEAEITNFAADADISSLFAVGFAAKGGKIQGRVKVTTIGLSGGALDQYVVTATSISEESLLKAIENLAILKSKVNTDEITVNPEKLPEGV